jgi:hypothetical protein
VRRVVIHTVLLEYKSLHTMTNGQRPHSESLCSTDYHHLLHFYFPKVVSRIIFLNIPSNQLTPSLCMFMLLHPPLSCQSNISPDKDP